MRELDLYSRGARPKTFLVEFTRERNGSYTVEQAAVRDTINQYSSPVRRVNKREFVSSLNGADDITCL